MYDEGHFTPDRDENTFSSEPNSSFVPLARVFTQRPQDYDSEASIFAFFASPPPAPEDAAVSSGAERFLLSAAGAATGVAADAEPLL